MIHGKTDAANICLTFTASGNTEKVPTQELLKPERNDELLKHYAGVRPVIELPLLDLDDKERFAVLDFVSRLSCSFQAPTYVGEDLLDFVISHIVAGDSMEQARRAVLAATETAVLRYPDALPVACDRIAAAMRTAGNRTRREQLTSNLLKDARQILLQLQKANDERGQAIRVETVRVHDVFKDAPVDDEVVFPPDWTVLSSGITSRKRLKGDDATISTPVLVLCKGRDREKGTELVTLGWLECDAWIPHDVERAVISSAPRIVELAAYGLPVNSVNARLMVRYLADFLAVNESTLPVVHVTGQTGWDFGKDGQPVFLWGKTPIVNDGNRRWVEFRPADSGDAQLVRALHSHGNLDGWLAAIASIARFARVKLVLYASFVPPIQRILTAPNFNIYCCGESSCGKTTTLRISGSVWGHAFEGDQTDSVLHTWDSTPVWLERAAAVQNNIPFIVDDTQRVRRPEQVMQTFYDVAQGKGRARGSIQGLAGSMTCQTVLLSTGENHLASFVRAGGGIARSLTLWGSPFGERSEAIGRLITQVNEGIAEHYGHAGPEFVRFLLAHQDQWNAWRERYRSRVQYYAQRAADHPVGSRVAAYFGAIDTAAWLVHQALGLPWQYEDPIEPLIGELLQESRGADLATEALRHVIGWAWAHEKDFHPRGGERQPPSGWAGVWPVADDWLSIGFLPDVLRRVLVEAGHDYESTLRTWKQRGWLEVDNDGRAQKSIRFEKGKVRVVLIRREAVDGVMVGG